MILREEGLTSKQESSTSYRVDMSKASSSSSKSWSKEKNPRIVHASRTFGGKDRHSKVYTVRGLRDRRIRLSVPTAIQLYDLQERLGLNQPSKVVDWLLNVAKSEIDRLPPLQIAQGSLFSHNLHPTLNYDPLKQTRSNKSWEKSKEYPGEARDHLREGNWERSEDASQFINFQEGQVAAFVSAHNLLSRRNSSSLLNGIFPYNTFVKRDPSDLTLYQNHGSGVQAEDLHNFSLVPLPSTLSVPSGSHQVHTYQPGMSTQSYFHPQINPMAPEFEQKQLHFQSLSLSNSPFTSSVVSSIQPVRPFPFSMNKDSEFH